MHDFKDIGLRRRGGQIAVLHLMPPGYSSTSTRLLRTVHFRPILDHELVEGVRMAFNRRVRLVQQLSF
jgi:hypothetical protein